MTKPLDKVNGNTKKVLKQTRTKDGRFDKALVTKAQIVKELWKRGNLKYKIKEYQLPLFNSLHTEEARHGSRVILCSRRWGKTYSIMTYIIEECIKNADFKVRIVAPNKQQLRKILRDLVNKIIKDSPSEYVPKFNVQDQVYVFPNGSEIHLYGSDNGNHESIRGNDSNLVFIDEASSIDHLDYVIASIINPVLFASNGQLIISSTRSKDITHFFEQLVDNAEADGTLQLYDIHTSDYSESRKQRFKKEAEELEIGSWEREFLCQRIIDQKRHVIPEFNEELHVRVRNRDKDSFDSYHHRYVFADLGFRDLTVFLFGTYVFSEARLYIENEWISQNEDNTLTTDIIAKNVKQTERETFGNIIPLLRVGDNDNPLLFNDLTVKHQYPIFSVHKQDKESMINQLKVMFTQNRIAIDPKCKNLITTLKSALWNNNRTDFQRNKIIGHADSISALIYGIISIDYNRNPIPFTQLINPETQIVNPLSTTNYINNDSKRFEALQKAFTSHLED